MQIVNIHSLNTYSNVSVLITFDTVKTNDFDELYFSVTGQDTTGSDQSITLPTSFANLQGSVLNLNSDGSGMISIVWSIISKPSVTSPAITNPDDLTTSIGAGEGNKKGTEEVFYIKLFFESCFSNDS